MLPDLTDKTVPVVYLGRECSKITLLLFSDTAKIIKNLEDQGCTFVLTCIDPVKAPAQNLGKFRLLAVKLIAKLLDLSYTLGVKPRQQGG